MNDTPKFLFALREDVKDDKRFLPDRVEPQATGYDCRACPGDRKDIIVRPGQTVRIPLGFRTFCPQGWYYLLHPRSSFFAKKHMHALIGVIDETFPLETCLLAKYLPDANTLTQDLVIKFGDPIAQIVPVRREDMNRIEVSNEEIEKLFKDRGAMRTGGIGSSDKGFYKTGGDK